MSVDLDYLYKLVCGAITEAETTNTSGRRYDELLAYLNDALGVRNLQGVTQAERLDHISTLGQAAELERKLATVSAALNEACEIAESLRVAVDRVDAWEHVEGATLTSETNVKHRLQELRSLGGERG